MKNNCKLNSSIVAILMALLVPLLVPAVSQGQTLFSVDRDSDLLREINPANGSTISTISITLAGEVVVGATGLAANPVTGVLFALLNLNGVMGRELVSVNPVTGVATSVGNTGDSFAALAFANDGTLFGVTGDGASTPESLFSLSTTTAIPTLLTALGNGDDGEAIAFNPLDGLIYHASGLGPVNVEQIFESINPMSLVVTNIPFSGDDAFEVFALTPSASGGFLGCNIAGNLFSLTTGGLVANIGVTDHACKGLAFIPVIGIPTLPQWGLILLVLSLLSIGTWTLSAQPILAGMAVRGNGMAAMNLQSLRASFLIGQGMAGLGLVLYGVMVGPLVPHDLLGGFLSGMLIGMMTECYRRNRA